MSGCEESISYPLETNPLHFGDSTGEDTLLQLFVPLVHGFLTEASCCVWFNIPHSRKFLELPIYFCHLLCPIAYDEHLLGLYYEAGKIITFHKTKKKKSREKIHCIKCPLIVPVIDDKGVLLCLHKINIRSILRKRKKSMTLLRDYYKAHLFLDKNRIGD